MSNDTPTAIVNADSFLISPKNWTVFLTDEDRPTLCLTDGIKYAMFSPISFYSDGTNYEDYLDSRNWFDQFSYTDYTPTGKESVLHVLPKVEENCDANNT